MKAKLKAYLETVYSESRAHDETQTERAACWRNLHPDTGGSLCTLEIDKARKKAARQNLREAKLEDYVRMEVCDAGEFLRTYQKYYDVVFLDADRSQYTAYWPHLQRILTKPGSLLVVDNVLSHADEVQAFIALVEADKNFSSMVLDIGAGLLLASSV